MRSRYLVASFQPLPGSWQACAAPHPERLANRGEETMDGSLALGAESRAGVAACEDIRLFGQPSLEDHLDYMKARVIGGASADRKALCDEWRSANDYYYELETSEAGIADQVECRDLDAEMAPRAEEVMAHAHFRHAFDALPARFGMVELDRLVVFQRHVNRTFVDALYA